MTDALPGAKFNVKWSQGGELQGVADMVITQCHSDTQDVRSFSLDLDLDDADLSTVIEGNEKIDQYIDIRKLMQIRMRSAGQ